MSNEPNEQPKSAPGQQQAAQEKQQANPAAAPARPGTPADQSQQQK